MSDVVATGRRVALRKFTVDDRAFIWELVNDDDWLRYIGDRGVNTVEDAVPYLTNGPFASYEKHGFGLWCLTLRATETAIGMCGLLKREWLDDVDIGFALLPEFRGQGYAFEAAQLTLAHALDTLKLNRVAAIVSPENAPSRALLERLGMTARGDVRAPGAERDVMLYAIGAG